jgi:predicted AlkP superfamily pyrophosphatase or phosphodiesterase
MDNFILPDYENNSIVNLASSILNHFNIETPHKPLEIESYFKKRIILILIDGLGYNLFKNKQLDLIHKVITTTFPSTTSTAITSLLTAKTPGEHGVLGYISYLKELGGLTNILKYSHPIGGERDMFKDFLDLKDLVKVESIFAKMRDKGLKVKLIIPREISNSALSRLLHEGASSIEYVFHWDGMVALRKEIESDTDFIYAYFPQIDTLSHVYGSKSQEVMTALEEILNMISSIANKKSADTTLIITSDHGHVDVGKIFKVIEDKELMDVLTSPPFGDSRAVFLKSKKDLKEIFERKYQNFEIFSREEILKMKLLGNFKEEYIDRLGDYIAIPKDNSIMIYPFKKDNLNMLKSQHGGLLEDEMLIPLIIF